LYATLHQVVGSEFIVQKSVLNKGHHASIRLLVHCAKCNIQIICIRLCRQEVSSRPPEPISAIPTDLVGGAAQHWLMRSLCAVRVSVRCVRSVECIHMRIPTLRIAVLSVFSEPEFVAADDRVRRTDSHIGRIAVVLQRLVVTARIFSAVQLRADSRQRRQRVLHLRMGMRRRNGLPRQLQIVFEAVDIEIVEIVPIGGARCIGRVL